MDKFLYLAMAGAKQSLHAQQNNANNLANVSTVGFKASMDHFMARPVYGPGIPARAYVQDSIVGADYSNGPIQSTGRDLDIAINGNGWLAVQADDGSTAYSRRGDLRVGVNGILENGAGQPVLGEGGPVVIPEFESLVIGRDGTITIRAAGQAANTLVAVDRLRLVNPEAGQLQRGEDGLFRTGDGTELPLDATVSVTSGALESSNVNTVDTMVKMIAHARHYETQVKLMGLAKENDEASARLLRMS